MATESQRKEGPSVFEHRSIDDIYREIQDVYLSDQRPWIVGYSGGKDSTTALQLIWYALAKLLPEKRTKTVYVISSDTLVETPAIVNFIDTTLRRIHETAARLGMPFKSEKVRPILNETFWVNLIGRGYPAPWKTFRWCTDRMKIKPADRFIMDKVSKHGEVVLVLGVRRQESITRAQVMSLHKIKGTLLSHHSRFPQAMVYTPVEDFSLRDIWAYLLQVPSPWGNNNRDLVALYKAAQGGECPLVVDDKTSSCGNSRFGCWVCTVVEHDRTMEALVEAGEDWMEPLLEFRDFLASTQDPTKKHLYREYKRRNGQAKFKSDGSGVLARGPYKFEFCKELLRRLLQTQLQVRKRGPDPNLTLISEAELHEIRRLWCMERGDWQDSVPQIYSEVIGSDLKWVSDDFGAFTAREGQILEELCYKHNVPFRLVTKLLDVEREMQGMSRRSSIYNRIESIFLEEWRAEEEIMQAHSKSNQNVDRSV